MLGPPMQPLPPGFPEKKKHVQNRRNKSTKTLDGVSWYHNGRAPLCNRLPRGLQENINFFIYRQIEIEEK